MNKELELTAAQKLFFDFHGRAPRGQEIATLNESKPPGVLLEVGALVSVGYRAKDGKTYYHEFEARRPSLYVTADGAQIFIIGGAYKFTARGFIK